MPLLLLPLHLTLLVCGAVATLVSGMLAWPRRRLAGGVPLLLLLLAIATWQAASAVGLAVETLEGKRLWAQVQYLGIATVSPLWLHFVQSYLGVPAEERRRWTWGSATVATVTIIAALTSAHHHLLWTAVILVQTGDGPRAMFSHGPLFWVAAACNYVFLARATVRLLRAPRPQGTVVGRQRRILLVAGTAPWVANAAYLSGLSDSWGGDPTPLAFAITGICAAIAIAELGLLELAPARQWRAPRPG